MLTYEQASDKVIIALDCSRERAFELADMLSGKATWVKVGMTLFYAEGPAIVDAMRERGLRVFLDLKVHDIPFQVQGAVCAASLTGADILSIHGLGSSAMIAAARKGAEEAAEQRGGDRAAPRCHLRPHEHGPGCALRVNSAPSPRLPRRLRALRALPTGRAPTASSARRRRPPRCASFSALTRSS